MHLGMTECHIPLFSLTLTFDLLSRMIVSGAILLHLRYEPQIGVWMHFGIAECQVPFLGRCKIVDLDLASRIILLGAYLLHYLR